MSTDEEMVERVAQAIRDEITKQWNEPGRLTTALDATRIAQVSLKALGLLEPTMEIRCQNCRFYDEVCRRHAPLFFARENHAAIKWPIVGPQDWCGEYQVDAAALERMVAEALRAKQEAAALAAEAARRAVQEATAKRLADAADLAERKAAAARAEAAAYATNERTPESEPSAKPRKKASRLR